MKNFNKIKFLFIGIKQKKLKKKMEKNEKKNSYRACEEENAADTFGHGRG